MNALVNSPRGVVATGNGSFYFADTLNNRVRSYQPGGNLFTYAGNGNASYFGDDLPANRAAVNAPEGIALDNAGNLYIADTSDNAVRKVTAAGTITTIAGTGTPGFQGDGGLATKAQLFRPRAVAVDNAGNVYVADSGNNRVRRIDPLGNIVTVAGTGETGFAAGDGPGPSTALFDPRGVAVDAAGNVYISDTGHNRIRKLFPSGAITTIAGFDGTCCYAGDGDLAIGARLNQPTGLAIDADGDLYVADTGNSAIRVLRPVSVNASVAAATNAASNAVGPIAPGELVTIYGSGLDLVKSVLFGGLAAPILYTTPNQLGAVVPYGISGANLPITVDTGTATATPLTVPVAAVAPGIFTVDGSGKGQAAALNQDHTANNAANATIAGQVITLFVTGEGQTTPAGVDGRIADDPLPKPLAPVTVTIGGLPATVQYAGGAPGIIAGVMQVNAAVPDRVFGNQPVVVSVGGVPTQTGVTIAIR